MTRRHVNAPHERAVTFAGSARPRNGGLLVSLMKHVPFVYLLAVTAAFAAGCRQQQAASLLPDSFPGERRADPSGALQFDPPMPLHDIAARPIDLAILDREQVASRISVSGDNVPIGRKDVPWVARHQQDAATDGEFKSSATPYWSAPAPAWAEVELTELAYVSHVIVEPYSTDFGVSEISVHLFGPDGIELPVAENVALATDTATLRPPAIVATIPPRVAKRVKILFTKTGAAPEPNVYVRRIRVMGMPVAGPFMASPSDMADPLRQALADNRQDLAVLTPETAIAQLAPPGELAPGSATLPWLADSSTENAVWAAPEPAAVTVDLAKPCYVDRVIVWPHTEALGLHRFYVKVVSPDGHEADTTPVADVTGPDVQPPGTGLRPAPMTATFEPQLVQKLRVYLPDGGYANNVVYVRKIQVLGIPATE